MRRQIEDIKHQRYGGKIIENVGHGAHRKKITRRHVRALIIDNGDDIASKQQTSLAGSLRQEHHQQYQDKQNISSIAGGET